MQIHIRPPEGNTTADLFDWSPPIAPDTYPNSPGYQGDIDGPSHLAAQAIAPAVSAMQRKVLDVLEGGENLTADQIAIRLERSPLSIRPRVSELHLLGLIEAKVRGRNESGMTANRWRAVSP